MWAKSSGSTVRPAGFRYAREAMQLSFLFPRHPIPSISSSLRATLDAMMTSRSSMPMT